jgi:hypothetical protein
MLQGLETSMAGMELEVRAEPALGPDVRRYRVACAHGASSAVLIPGRERLVDLAVLDLLLAGHHRRQRCQCVPAMPALTTEARA